MLNGKGGCHLGFVCWIWGEAGCSDRAKEKCRGCAGRLGPRDSPLTKPSMEVRAAVTVLISQSYPTLANPWTIAHQAPLSLGFSRQEYWRWVPFLSPGDLPTQRSNSSLLHCRWILYQEGWRAGVKPQFIGVIPGCLCRSGGGVVGGDLRASGLGAPSPGLPEENNFIYFYLFIF